MNSHRGLFVSRSFFFPDDASDDVTCGSYIKVQHIDTAYYLNSEEKQLGAGSGQQIVTFVKDPATTNTLWWLRPAHHGVDGAEYPDEASCQLAEPVKCGGIIRLTHANTVKNLHSHGVQSILSKQQEVTAFGQGDGRGDGGDNWKVECQGSRATTWKRNQPVRLYHVDTGKYLGTSKKTEFNQQTCGHNCPIMNHLESFGRSAADSYSLLKVEQGVHLSK
jgi:dolichyl-phosphate-mannose--protein O-mannosyl transferase